MKTEKYFYDLAKASYPKETEESLNLTAKLMYFGYKQQCDERKQTRMRKIINAVVKYIFECLLMYVVYLVFRFAFHAPDWAGILAGTVWIFIVFYPETKHDNKNPTLEEVSGVVMSLYERTDDSKTDYQCYNGEWYFPIFGCDTLQQIMDGIESLYYNKQNEEKK